MVQMDGPADRIRVRIYSKAMVLAAEVNFENPIQGWNEVPLPMEDMRNWSNGLYYYNVTSYRGSEGCLKGRKGQIFILR